MNEEKRKAKLEYLKDYYVKNKDKRKKYLDDNKEKISLAANERAKKYYHENKEIIKEKNKIYREINKDKLSAYQKVYREENRDKGNQYSNEYYKQNKKELLKKQKEYLTKNKEKRNNYIKTRKKNDIIFRLTCNNRSYISTILKKRGYTKNSKCYQLLGCSFEELKTHLESKFEPWMSWNNYGLYNGTANYGWDIDHIIPLSSAKTEKELLSLFHFKNCQPLCSKENRDIKKHTISFSESE
jgi:hypothetical protein